MKKVLLALVAVFAMGIAANAQQAIGARLGGSYGLGGEISYQKDLGANRLELDLGASFMEDHTYLNVTGIYQWTGTIQGNFGWYAGVGGMLGLWSHHDDSGFLLCVAGQAGVEYNFQAIPLQLSLDWRPTVDIAGAGKFLHFNGAGIALGIRYRF